MSSIIEENAKFFADYLKSLSIISYDEIVNMIKDKDNIYQIEFYDQFDLYNEIHYSCVTIMKNNYTSALERYVTEDQDVKAVYTNLISKLRDNDIEPVLQQLYMYSSYPNFVCRIGLNDIILPVELTKDLSQDADLILYLVDSTAGIVQEDFDFIKAQSVPVIIRYKREE